MTHYTKIDVIKRVLRRTAKHFLAYERPGELIDPKLENARYNAVKKKLTDLENYVAPQEYLEAVRGLAGRLPSLHRRAMDQPIIAELVSSKTIKKFARKELETGVTFYHAPGNSAKKRLLVVCAGYAMRPGMPMPALLQRIDDRHFDVLVLRDQYENHFRRGVSLKINSLEAVVAFIAELRNQNSYLGLYTLGTSGGALPAIRIALMSNAERAISCGGLFPDDTLRILRNQVQTLSSYDRICACLHPQQRDFYFVYSTQRVEYRLVAENAAHLTGGTVIEVEPVMNHAVLGSLWISKQLDEFLPMLLHCDSPIDFPKHKQWSKITPYGYLFDAKH